MTAEFRNVQHARKSYESQRHLVRESIMLVTAEIKEYKCGKHVCNYKIELFPLDISAT